MNKIVEITFNFTGTTLTNASGSTSEYSLFTTQDGNNWQEITRYISTVYPVQYADLNSDELKRIIYDTGDRKICVEVPGAATQYKVHVKCEECKGQWGDSPTRDFIQDIPTVPYEINN